MEAIRDVGLVKLVVFSTLFHVISGSNDGYLFMNLSRTPHCYSMPVNNTQCPTKVINYKVVDFDSGLEVTKTSLLGVKIIMNTLSFFPNVTKACRKSLREYSCSNMFANCSSTTGIITAVTYDYQRTAKACAKTQATCPIVAQAATIYNCTNIMTNPMEFLQCIPLPNVTGDVCTKTNYKYSLPTAKVYPQVTEMFLYAISKMQQNMNSSCLTKYINIACQLNAGPICSDDGTLRMFAMSRQQCATTMQECLPGQKYFKILCKIFPENTAKRVPLPSVVNTNANSVG